MARQTLTAQGGTRTPPFQAVAATNTGLAPRWGAGGSALSYRRPEPLRAPGEKSSWRGVISTWTLTSGNLDPWLVRSDPYCQEATVSQTTGLFSSALKGPMGHYHLLTGLSRI